MSAVTTVTSIRPFGELLKEADYTSLEARWIDRDLANRAGICRVSSDEGRMMFGQKRGNCAGILIPNVLPGTQGVREYRLRLDEP